MAIWRRFSERLEKSQLPSTELLDGLIILVSGALLITPGILTDFAGFLGLLPFSRALIRSLIMRRLKKANERGELKVQFNFFGAASPFSNSGQESEEHPEWEGTPRKRPDHTT